MRSLLNSQEIEQHLPHAGKMSLLDKVSYADRSRLSATATSHLNSDNPLRFNGRLATINGIEYAAQAMAIHGFLLTEATLSDTPLSEVPTKDKLDSIQTGYIATVRNIDINSPFFPENISTLLVEVEQLMSDNNGFTYQFHISCEKKTLISGKITIFLIKT